MGSAGESGTLFLEFLHLRSVTQLVNLDSYGLVIFVG